MEQMRSIFWVASPNLLLVHPMDELDDLLACLRKVVRVS